MESPTRETVRVRAYFLQVTGLFGRNRKYKFERTKLEQIPYDDGPLSDVELGRQVQVALFGPEGLKLKHGTWKVMEEVLDIETRTYPDGHQIKITTGSPFDAIYRLGGEEEIFGK